jgi:hypothetical protein
MLTQPVSPAVLNAAPLESKRVSSSNNSAQWSGVDLLIAQWSSNSWLSLPSWAVSHRNSLAAEQKQQEELSLSQQNALQMQESMRKSPKNADSLAESDSSDAGASGSSGGFGFCLVDDDLAAELYYKKAGRASHRQEKLSHTRQNPLSIAGRERQIESAMLKQSKMMEQQSQEIEQSWTQDVTASQLRRAAKEASEADKAEKRRAKQLLFEQDRSSLDDEPAHGKKTTAFELAAERSKQGSVEAVARDMASQRLIEQPELTINPNHLRKALQIADEEQFGAQNVLHASSIDDAIAGFASLNKEELNNKLPTFLRTMHPKPLQG